jgi:hypothetical protein
MRRAERKIQDEAKVRNLLAHAAVGHLGTIGKDGYPRIKPLNFVYADGHIYFHSARQGEKIEDILRDGRICFEVDVPIRFVQVKDTPCSASYHYRSVILTGRAEIVEDPEEKLAALRALMEKYQPGAGWGAFPAANLALTAVVRINIEAMTGKEHIAKR